MSTTLVSLLAVASVGRQFCSPLNSSSRALFSLDFSVLPAGARPFECGGQSSSTFMLVENFFTGEELQRLLEAASYDRRAPRPVHTLEALYGVPVPPFASERLAAFVAPGSPRRGHRAAPTVQGCAATAGNGEGDGQQLGTKTAEPHDASAEGAGAADAADEGRVIRMLDTVNVDQFGTCAEVNGKRERPPQFSRCAGAPATEEPMFMYEDGPTHEKVRKGRRGR